MCPAHWWGLFSLPRSVSPHSHSTPPFTSLTSLNHWVSVLFLSRASFSCRRCSFNTFIQPLTRPPVLVTYLMQVFISTVHSIILTKHDPLTVIVQMKTVNTLLTCLVGSYLHLSSNRQSSIPTEAKLVKRKTCFLGCGGKTTWDEGGSVLCALNQDCAADFCLARQISGGWKIIWSWLWEVVGSEWVGEKFWGVTGWWEEEGVGFWPSRCGENMLDTSFLSS